MSFLDDDLAEMFSDDFAIPVTTPGGGEIQGIFTDASIEDEVGESALLVSTADVIAHSLTIGARVSLTVPLTGLRQTYVIGGRQHDGTGLSDMKIRPVSA